MKILLIGEYSRLHLTLAEGLKAIGYEATIASDGDGFKNYYRDIDLFRKSSNIADTLSSALSTLQHLSRFKEYDIVQFINPLFTPQNVRINKYLYQKIKKQNKKVFLGAFGEDYYWLDYVLNRSDLRYSEFSFDGKSINQDERRRIETTWLNKRIRSLNTEIASESDGIIACLYEYLKAYEPSFSNKLTYIPLPINTDTIEANIIHSTPDKINIFIGINTERSVFKGTDIMEKALIRIAEKYPEKVNILRAEKLDYTQYQQMMSQAHIVLDQLYSYSPAMNALTAMAQGKVVIGGGEDEIYEILNEKENKPIVNIIPTEADVFAKIEHLVLNPELIPTLSSKSRAFVETHHNYKKVAQQYINFWKRNIQ